MDAERLRATLETMFYPYRVGPQTDFDRGVDAVLDAITHNPHLLAAPAMDDESLHQFAAYHRSLPHDDGVPRSACMECRLLAVIDRLAAPAVTETAREVFRAADAFMDELDAPPGHPLSDHYHSQAEVRVRAAIEAYRAALATDTEEASDGR